MRLSLLAGLCAAGLVAGTAVAQPVPPGDPKAPPSEMAPAERPGPRPDGPRPPPPPPPPSGAGHIRLEQGPLKVEVKCPESESLRACADIAREMADLVLGAPGERRGPPPPPPPRDRRP